MNSRGERRLPFGISNLTRLVFPGWSKRTGRQRLWRWREKCDEDPDAGFEGIGG